MTFVTRKESHVLVGTPKPLQSRFRSSDGVWSTTAITVEKEAPVSHNIYVCTVNDKQTVDLISAAILGMGIKTSPAADDGSLYHGKTGSKTTMMAIRVDNFNTELSNSEILDRVCKAIDRYTYFGIVLKHNDKGTSWRAGNVGNKEFEHVMEKADQEEADNAKPEKPTEPNPTDAPLRVDLKTVAKIVKATANMSDIFFDDIPQEDRRLLARELEKLCEDPTASLTALPKG